MPGLMVRSHREHSDRPRGGWSPHVVQDSLALTGLATDATNIACQGSRVHVCMTCKLVDG